MKQKQQQQWQPYPYAAYSGPPAVVPVTPSPPAKNNHHSFDSANNISFGASMDDSVTTAPSLESTEAWRKHGKVFRAKLALVDEEKGGNTFVLSDNCSIDRYYRVAERVSQVPLLFLYIL
jgi:hypothetical protein